jgi:hypothetical protein
VTTTDAATNAPATKRYHYEDNRSLNTHYTYNAKGRVTRQATYPASYQSAMTAPPLGAAESVSSTQWHGTWNLPLKVAEAYLITSYSYDVRGNLLEMVETPTTDITGAKGFNATPSGTTYTTRWTYDANNLPTTIVELAGSVETGRWDMTYNPTGDLTGITHVTSGTVATLVPVGNGESRVTAISDTGAVALLRSRARVLYLAQFLVAPAEATSPALMRILIPYFAAEGGSIAVGDIISAAKFHPAISRTVGIIITAAGIVSAVCTTPCDPPEGTRCYEDLHYADHGGLNPHYHVYQMQKIPDSNGNRTVCSWQYLGGKIGKGVFGMLPPYSLPLNINACSSYPNFIGRPHR